MKYVSSQELYALHDSRKNQARPSHMPERPNLFYTMNSISFMYDYYIFID